MRVTVKLCQGYDSYHDEYVFWHKEEVVARCDESDYHETVAELERDGYVVQ